MVFCTVTRTPEGVRPTAVVFELVKDEDALSAWVPVTVAGMLRKVVVAVQATMVRQIMLSPVVDGSSVGGP